MPSKDDIDQQQQLLATYRRNLAHELQRAAQYGGPAFAPVEVANSIAAARAEIRRIEARLRAWGVEVADYPNEAEESSPELHGSAAALWWNRRTRAGFLVLIVIIVLLISVRQLSFLAALIPIRAPALALPTAINASTSPLTQATSVPAIRPTAANTLVTITFTTITIHRIPRPEPLDLLESKDEGDITINFNVAGQPRRWPVEPQVKHMHVGNTAQIGETFQVSVASGSTPMFAIDVLEMDPEKGNENDLLLRATQLIDLTSAPQTSGVIRDQANGYAEIAYTVSVTPLP